MKLRAVVGLCTLCALVISAVAAQGASAQTAYTCASGGTQFSNSSCTTAGTGWGHVEVAPNSATSITGVGGLTKLKSTQSGVTLELQSTELTGTGTMENKAVGSEMIAHGTGVITYKNVSVTAPAGLGCKVVQTTPGQLPMPEEIVTKSLTATTQGLTNELKFIPQAGSTTAFAEFEIEGCSIGALNHIYVVKGEVKGQTKGTATNFTHTNVTGQKTLTLQGQLAGIEGTLEIKGANGNGLALT